MEQYISKSALVAEIERQISAIDNCPKITDTQISVLEGDKVVLTKLLSFIDTLEAKEVDLKNELKEDWIFADKTEVDCLECMCLTEDMFVSLAKKYFELGLKAQKGEDL